MQTLVPLQKGALNDACRKVAAQTLWTPIGTSADLVETLAAKLQDIAERYDEYIIGQGRDPNVITRAINYVADVHAIPPQGADTAWFDAILSSLLELAVPNTGISVEALPFFADIRQGMAQSIEDLNE